MKAGWVRGDILFHADPVPHSVKGDEQRCFAAVIHKPYGYLEVQEEGGGGYSAFLQERANDATRMLCGQTVQSSLCIMSGQARGCVGTEPG